MLKAYAVRSSRYGDNPMISTSARDDPEPARRAQADVGGAEASPPHVTAHEEQQQAVEQDPRPRPPVVEQPLEARVLPVPQRERGAPPRRAPRPP